MGLSLKDQLVKKGLVDENRAHKLEVQMLADHFAGKASAPVAKTDHRTAEDLLNAATVALFCDIAKELLLRDFGGYIGQVISIAHNFKASMDAKTYKGFIWRMYQVRDRYPRCPEGKRETFLDRAFRRHNPTVEIPE